MDFSESEGVEKDEDGSDGEITMAHQAADTGNVEQLVEAIKVDPSLLEQVDGEGLTPLARAVMAGQLEVVKRLVKIGASIHAQDVLGRTVLAMAAYQGWYDGVYFLLRNGARQNVCDKAGRTPLHAATYDTDARTLSVLLQNMSANEVNAADYEGMTALHWTAFHDRPRHLELLQEKGGDITLEDIDGKSCLHWAAQNGSLKCCQAILQNSLGAQLINKVDHSGKTAVHFASAAGHVKILKLLSTVPGCDFEAEDPDERTPLHWAAATGQADSARFLLQLGVNTEPVDAEGGTPLDYAKQTHHTECINVFEQHLGMRMTQPSSNGSNSSRESTPSQSSQPPNKKPFSFFRDLFSKKHKNTNRQQMAPVSKSKSKVDKNKNKPESDLEKLHLSRLDNPRSLDQGDGDARVSRDLNLPLGNQKQPLPPTGGGEHMIRSPPPVLGNPVENDVKKKDSKKAVTVVSPQKPQQLAPLKGAPKLGALPPSLMHEKVAALKRETAKQRTPTPPATLEQVLESQSRSNRKTSLSSASSQSATSNRRLSDMSVFQEMGPTPIMIVKKKKTKRKHQKPQLTEEVRKSSASDDISPRPKMTSSMVAHLKGLRQSQSLETEDDSNNEGGNEGGDEDRNMAFTSPRDTSNKLTPSPRLESQQSTKIQVKPPQGEEYKQQRLELDKNLQGLLY